MQEVIPTNTDFYGTCEVKTPCKCVAMKGGHVTAVWNTQDCTNINVCKPCMDEKIHNGEWILEREKVRGMKQGFADIAVYSEEDDFDTPRLIVEITKIPDAPSEEANEIYSQAVKDPVISEVPYFLLATPDIFYLWCQKNTHKDQASEIKTDQFLNPYLKAHSLNRANIAISEDSEFQEKFKDIVRKWLTDIITTQNELPDFPDKSGLCEAIADGFVKTDVFIPLESYAVEQGEDARSEGQPLSANPYDPVTQWNQYRSWIEGWETDNWILESLLAQKKQKLEAEYPQWDKERNEWIGRVNNLFTLIHSWLEPLVHNDYLKISYNDISISEQSLGRYSVQKMIITFFNNEKIELTPIGFHIIGARGRVDMEIGMRTVGIIGIYDDSGWMFSERENRRGKPKTWRFDKHNFESLLTEFAEAF
ncbi:hypothetical protein QUF72_01285 [Desulfobacterales bacterium HSG2]|nr:hypothetical protein [Desulfobacterales bacterium HSG2]